MLPADEVEDTFVFDLMSSMPRHITKDSDNTSEKARKRKVNAMLDEDFVEACYAMYITGDLSRTQYLAKVCLKFLPVTI